jgi:hypothetical protein
MSLRFAGIGEHRNSGGGGTYDSGGGMSDRATILAVFRGFTPIGEGENAEKNRKLR